MTEMAAAWKHLPGAPEEGTLICQVDEVTPVYSVDLNGFPILLLRTAAGLRAYVNMCPHQHLPMEWRSKEILSADGKIVRCSNHDAGFDAITGEGVTGFGANCSLDAVPVTEQAGEILIGDRSK